MIRFNPIGAFLAGADATRDNLARQTQAQAAAQQGAAAAAAAAQQAAQSASGLLRPPNTGDAGLLGQDGSQDGVAFLIVAVGLTMALTDLATSRLSPKLRRQAWICLAVACGHLKGDRR